MQLSENQLFEYAFVKLKCIGPNLKEGKASENSCN